MSRKLAATQELLRKDTEIAIERKEREKREVQAQGIANAMQIIRGQLSPMYIQHEAIEAQKQMVNSPNHTVVYIPVGPMGVPDDRRDEYHAISAGASETLTRSRPGQDLDLRRSGGRQALPHTIDVRRRDMDAQQDGAARHFALQRVGALVWETGGRQDRCEAAGHMSGDFAKLRRERPCRHDRPNPRHHQGDGGEHAAAQLARRAAGRESSRSTPAVASIRSASACASAWVWATTEMDSRVIPSA